MNISHLKKQAKGLQKLYPALVATHGERLSLSAAQAVIAQLNGFPGWEQLIESTEARPAGTQESASKRRRAPEPALSLSDAIDAALELNHWGPKELALAISSETGEATRTADGYQGRFDYRTRAIQDEIWEVEEDHDETIDVLTGGTGEYDRIPERTRKELAGDLKQTLKKHPAYIDGHAAHAGLLFENEDFKGALAVAEPVAKHLLAMIDKVIKSIPQKTPFQMSYYELPNRPFFRLMHVYVLALWKCGRGKDAKRMCKRMLKLHPMDNIGFRFLVDGIGEED